MTIGRPTDYTEALADEICEKVSTDSRSLVYLCVENPHWPHRSNVYKWLLKHPYFRDKYAQAKRQQVEAIVDDILDIADDTMNDTLTKTNQNGEEYEVQNSEWINRSRLRVDTRKWMASKLAPKLYGDNVGMRELYEEIAELKRELANKGIKNGNTENNHQE